MSPSTEPAAEAVDAPSTRTEELRSFLFFTVVMAPALAVAIVGGYGFLVWMYQLVAGPPQG
jgi:nitrate reductase NapE